MPETYPVGEMPARLEREVKEILARLELKRLQESMTVLRRAAKAGAETRFFGDREHGGYVAMRNMPAFFHYWGQRLGYDCWKDKQFEREFLRDNPECRVRSRNVNPTVGYRQGMEGLLTVRGGTRRETKVYPANNNQEKEQLCAN